MAFHYGFHSSDMHSKCLKCFFGGYMALPRSNACFAHLIFFPYSQGTNVVQNKPKISFVIFF